MLMRHDGVYVIAAVVAMRVTDRHRDALRAAVPRRTGRRWHWHSGEHDDRCRLLDCMAALDLQFVVSWVPMDDPRHQERARAITLRRLRDQKRTSYLLVRGLRTQSVKMRFS